MWSLTIPLVSGPRTLYRCGMKTFAEVLDMADSMSPEDREDLVSILQSRLREERRAKLVEDVAASREEFAAGNCRPASVDEVIKSILQ